MIKAGSANNFPNRRKACFLDSRKDFRLMIRRIAQTDRTKNKLLNLTVIAVADRISKNIIRESSFFVDVFPATLWIK
jgi:hypothetical protein